MIDNTTQQDEALKKLPARYSVVAYMDVLAHNEEQAQAIMDLAQFTLNCLAGIRNAKVEEI